MTLGALLSHRPILQMWTLRYRSGDTALAKILNDLSGAGVRLHPAIEGRGLSQWRKEHRWDLETPRKAVQLGKGCQSWVMGLGAVGRGIRREEGRPNVS